MKFFLIEIMFNGKSSRKRISFNEKLYNYVDIMNMRKLKSGNYPFEPILLFVLYEFGCLVIQTNININNKKTIERKKFG